MTDDNYEKGPTLFQMVKTFSKEIVKYVAHGAPNVSVEDYIDRLDTCSKCPHIQKEKMQCKICGCVMEMKAKWKTAVCPDNPSRWKPQVPVPPNSNFRTAEENGKK